MDYGIVSIQWHKVEAQEVPVQARLVFPAKKSKFRECVRRWRSMDYRSDLIFFGQIFNELFLVPSVYHFSDRALVHAAAYSIDGKAYLLAGTGGVGKSSALLTLRDDSTVAFLSDDIVVLSSDGHIYPNFSWPKIYAYNIAGQVDLRRRLLSGRGLFDRLQFEIRSRYNPSTVRRVVAPDDLFAAVDVKGSPLDTVFYLTRSANEQIGTESLSVEQLVVMSQAVMFAEHMKIHQYLAWDRYNSSMNKQKPLCNQAQEGMQAEVLRAAFSTSSNTLFRLPISMKHSSFVEYIHSQLLLQ